MVLPSAMKKDWLPLLLLDGGTLTRSKPLRMSFRKKVVHTDSILLISVALRRHAWTLNVSRLLTHAVRNLVLVFNHIRLSVSTCLSSLNLL